jgi:hypothetical protein
MAVPCLSPHVSIYPRSAVVSSKLDQQLATLAAQQQQLDDTANQLTDLAASTEAQTARTISDTIAMELGIGASHVDILHDGMLRYGRWRGGLGESPKAHKLYVL